jgi:hypothetical protein
VVDGVGVGAPAADAGIAIDYEFDDDTGAAIANDTLSLPARSVSDGPDTLALALKNNGATDFAILSDPPLLVAGANASAFAVSSQPADVVPAGQSVPFTIVFTPSDAGANEGKLLFAYGVDTSERAVLTIDVTVTAP